MRGIKPFKLGFLTRPFQWGQQHQLGVTVLAYFGFEPVGQLFTDVEMWETVAEELAGPIDVGIPKSRAEVVVTGRCFTPEQKEQITCPVRVRVGNIDKSLNVIGDRVWNHDVPTSPRPFTEMPLDWTRSYGGEGYEKNPLGLGFAKVMGEDGVARQELPNVEMPGAMLTSPHQHPEPAGFGPLDFVWPQRFSLAGTYDKQWLDHLYPGFAQDIDWRIWNVASADQTCVDPFRGDESFLLENLHPSRPWIEGKLPGIRGRAFVTRKGHDGSISPLEEVGLQLMTVWFFPHLERGVLMFQGATPIQEDDAADIDTIMVAGEKLSESRPLTHYADVLRRRTGPEADANPSVHLNDDELVPPGQAGLTPETQKQLELLKNEGLIAGRAQARMDAEFESAREKAASFGLDPEEHGPPAALPPAELPQPALDELGDQLQTLMAKMATMKSDSSARREAETERVAELYAGLGLDFDEVRGEVAAVPTGPPEPFAEAMRERMSKLHKETVALGEPVDELEFFATDEEWLSHLRDKEREMNDAYRLTAHHQTAAAPMDAEATKALAEEIEARIRGNESLAGRDLTGVDLSGRSLAGADFSGAFLESARLVEADFSGANLAGAVFAHSDLSNARLVGANLAGANLGKATLRGAKLEGLDLSSAVLWGTDLRGADLTRTRIDGAMLMETKLAGADLSGASMDTAFFIEADLTGCRFVGSNLSTAVLYKAQLAGVDFGGATVDQATFYECVLDGASFVNARMEGTRAVGQEGSWEKVDFRGAHMVGANLRGTRLLGSDFSGACLDKADLSEADLREARFYRAVARDCLLIKSDLRGAFMVSIDLLRALVQKADLRGADLRGANLYGADFALIRSDAGTNVTDANQSKVRTMPRRTETRSRDA